MYRAYLACLGVLPATILTPVAGWLAFGGAMSLMEAPLVGVVYLTLGVGGLCGAAGLWIALVRGPSRIATLGIAFGMLSVVSLYALLLLLNRGWPSLPRPSLVETFDAFLLSHGLFVSPLIMGGIEVWRYYRPPSLVGAA